VKFLRERRCFNEECIAFRPEWDTTVSVQNMDSEWKKITEYYFSDYNQLLQFVSGEGKSKNSMDEICGHCHNQAMSSILWPEGMPDIFFYTLQHEGSATRESQLPSVQIVNGEQYTVFAYSLFIPGDGAHYMTVLMDNGNRLLYDGLRSNLTSHGKKKLSDTPVVGVWLVKNFVNES
jgi:hypothetical protein